MKSVSLLLLSIFPLLLSLDGCGGDTASSGNESTFAASQRCITCHDTTRSISTVTGAKINDEWDLSTHNTMRGASCIDCHGSGNGHPGSCGNCHGGSTTVGFEFHNPDNAGQCYKCHDTGASRFPLGVGKKHFDIYTTVDVVGAKVGTATWVGTQNARKCSGCHNPHNNTLLPEHREWAESGHGEVNAAPWIHYDFSARATCNRCHTTTGFTKYIKTGDAAAWTTKREPETLRCSACHTDYTYKRIDGKTQGLNGVKVPYGTFSSVILTYGKALESTTSTIYQDAGNSNLCINCHSGLVSGRTFFGNFTSYRRKTAQNSHYFAAAGNLYAASGYEYRPHSDYQLIYNGGLVFEHAELGMKNVTYRGHVINLGTTRGPCVACHMSDKNHSLKVVTVDTNVPGLDPRSPRAAINGTITAFPADSPVCGKCHKSPNPILSIGTPNTGIDILKREYRDRLAELEAALAAKGIIYDPDRVPYFWPVGANHNDRTKAFGAATSQDPITGLPTTWPNEGTLAAAFNLNLCFRDPGGYAHNHRYTARLIYDSLDFLDDGILNESYVSAAFPSGFFQRQDGTFYPTARPY